MGQRVMAFKWSTLNVYSFSMHTFMRFIETMYTVQQQKQDNIVPIPYYHEK